MRPPRISDDEVRALGFEPTPTGWVPLVDEVAERIAAADARRTDRSLSFVYESFRIPGKATCTVCGDPASPSTVGSPVCGAICSATLMHHLLERIGDELFTKPDGSGGRAPVRPITPPPSRKRLSVAPRGSVSVDRAVERLGSCSDVLERHGHRVRGRMAFCPFHLNERTPAISVYERDGHSRAHCHSCDWSGDALDLEAALAGDDLATTIRRWS